MRRNLAIMITLVVGWVFAGLLAGCGAGPTTVPAQSATETQVAELVSRLESKKEDERERAEKALVEMHAAHISDIQAQMEQLGPEGRSRAQRVLGKIAADAQMAHAAGTLEPNERDKLRRLHIARPELTRAFFSPDPRVSIKTLRAAREMEDPDGLVEPLLLLGLRHGSQKVVFAAAYAAGSARYRSDRLVDALIALLVAADRETWQRTWYRAGPRSSALTILRVTEALAAIGSKRAAAPLLAILNRREGPTSLRDASIAAAIALTGEKRAILHLIKLLDRTEVSFRITGRGPRDTMTTCTADSALMALIKLTGQDQSSYGFSPAARFFSPGASRTRYGFASDEARAEAVEKFMKWWVANQLKPEYVGLLMLDLPDVGPDREVPRRLGGPPRPRRPLRPRPRDH